MSEITVFHGVTEPDHWMGYAAGHDLRSVFCYEDKGDDLAICERAFLCFNADDDLLDERDRELAVAYRAGRLRSLSMGDVVRIRDGAGERYLACAMIGWDPIEPPALECLLGKS